MEVKLLQMANASTLAAENEPTLFVTERDDAVTMNP